MFSSQKMVNMSTPETGSNIYALYTVLFLRLNKMLYSESLLLSRSNIGRIWLLTVPTNYPFHRYG